MPPKKRETFQTRTILARLRESREGREARLEVNRDRNRARRQSHQHGALLREAERKRKADARANESKQQRAVRLKRSRMRIARTRAAAGMQQRTPRLCPDCIRKHTLITGKGSIALICRCVIRNCVRSRATSR